MDWNTHPIRSYFVLCALTACVAAVVIAIHNPFQPAYWYSPLAALIVVFGWGALFMWIPVSVVALIHSFKTLPPNFQMINCANPAHTTNDLLREQNCLLQAQTAEAITEVRKSWPMPKR